LITLEKVQRRAESDAKTHGYFLNHNSSFLKDLLEGLRQNEERYGYPSCPCRLATGKFDLDRDIICPCDYRDPDVEEYGCCYCALFVSKDVYEGRKEISSIPERRPVDKQISTPGENLKNINQSEPFLPINTLTETQKGKKKVWYCRQCGFMCFREEPPYICPVCKAKREIFAEVNITTGVYG
jgi:ferredoxin-thioredoxin reductase catalytic subunit